MRVTANIFYLFFVFFVLPIHDLCSQSSNKNHVQVNVNEKTESMVFSVLNSKKSIKISSQKFYFWYSSNQIKSTQGGYSGKLLDGVYTCFYLNNNLKEKGIFKLGLRDKSWNSWHENGKLSEVSIWNNGFKNGKSFIYNDKGELVKILNYKNSLLNKNQLYYQDGKIVEQKKYKMGVEIIKAVKPIKQVEPDSLKTQKQNLEKKSEKKAPKKNEKLNSENDKGEKPKKSIFNIFKRKTDTAKS
jgi:hypothetical protein